MSCECNKISLRAFFLVFLAVNVYVLTCRIMKSTNIETLSTLSRGACKLLVIHTHHRRQRWHVFIQDIHVRIYTWGYVIANYNHEDYIGSEIKKEARILYSIMHLVYRGVHKAKTYKKYHKARVLLGNVVPICARMSAKRT